MYNLSHANIFRILEEWHRRAVDDPTVYQSVEEHIQDDHTAYAEGATAEFFQIATDLGIIQPGHPNEQP